MYKHGHHDRDCCDPSHFDGTEESRKMRSKTLRDSLIYGTRVVRHKGLKVDDSMQLVEYKGHSRPIRDSIVYGTRQKRCRHKQCTAWHHFHEFNKELDKWDFPDQIAQNEEKRVLWLAARKSVLDEADIRRKSIQRNCYGELDTEAGHYAGEFLRTFLRPWENGNHSHDMYRQIRHSRIVDFNFEELRTYYDPRPEAIESHKKKIKDLVEWQRVKSLERDMKWELLRIQGIQRCRSHFQHLKVRLETAKMLWSELNRNSVWWFPWPEGDHVPELVRRSLMMISKRLSTCAPMWNPNFADIKALEHYLNNLEDLAPEVWERFHYNCKLHKHLDLHERRATRLESIRKASLPQEPEPPIQLPLCEPVATLQKQIAALIASLPQHLQCTPKSTLTPGQEDDTILTNEHENIGVSRNHKQKLRDLGTPQDIEETDQTKHTDLPPIEISPSKAHKTKEKKFKAYAMREIKALDIFDEKLELDRLQSNKKPSKGIQGDKDGKAKKYTLKESSKKSPKRP